MKRTAAALLIIAAAMSASRANARDVLEVFVDYFPEWVENSVWLDFCTSRSETDRKVKEVLDQAESVFFPGWLEWSARAKFRDDMEFQAAKAAIQGRINSQNGCFGVEALEKVGRDILDEAFRIQTQGN